MDENDVVYCRTPPFNELVSLNRGAGTFISMKMDEYVQFLNESQFKFEFVDDPKIYSIEPSETILSGGLVMRIRGRDFDAIQTTHLIVSASPILVSSSTEKTGEMSSFFKSQCVIVNATNIECVIPQIRDKRMQQQNLNHFGQHNHELAVEPLAYSIYVQFNEISNKFANRYPGDLQHIQVYPDPVFDEAQLFSDKKPIILIKGSFYSFFKLYQDENSTYFEATLLRI